MKDPGKLRPTQPLMHLGEGTGEAVAYPTSDTTVKDPGKPRPNQPPTHLSEGSGEAVAYPISETSVKDPEKRSLPNL